ncbi:Toll/interleukin-1 receptor domain-containing protein [Tanacetum coccineum]
MEKPRLVLKFIWIEKNIRIALDQVNPGCGTIPNCHNLLRVCKTIGILEKLALLNMAGCKNLFNSVPISTSGLESALELSFPLPRSLQRVLLNDCNLQCTDYFPEFL